VEAGQGVAEEGAADVADVQALRDVRRGVVDHHGLSGALAIAAQIREVRPGLHVGGEPHVVQAQVQEPRARHAHLGEGGVCGERLAELLGGLLRRHSRGLAELERDVALVVTECGVLRGGHEVGVFGSEPLEPGGTHRGVDQGRQVRGDRGHRDLRPVA
jgi:hypothetical protein